VSGVVADCGECKIKSGPPEVLDEYIDTLQEVLDNVTSEIVQNDENEKTSSNYQWVTNVYEGLKSRLHEGLSLFTNWDGYYEYFDYYVIYGIKNEYVPEIRRDHTSLQKQSTQIDQYLKIALNINIKDTYLTKEQVCGDIENCDFEGSLIKVLGMLRNNNEKVLTYYRMSITGKKHSFKDHIELVSEDFFTEFNEYYNEYTTENCSACAGSFKDRISNAISKISNLQESAKDGIKEWQDAIAILNGSLDEREYERLERELLEEELSRQWVSSKGSQAVLKNLDRYNETWGFTSDNNFITNSFAYFLDSIQSEIDDFRDSVLAQYKGTDKKSVPIQAFNKNTQDFRITKSVEESISELYQKELPYAQMEDESTESLQARIIQLHYDLTKAIEMLDNAVPVSEKVCNDQARGVGKCDYE